MIRRLAASVALVLMVALPFGCGGQRGYGNEPVASACPAVPWGGWNGTPECAGIASIVISGEARVCDADSDCAIVAAGGCTAHAINQAAVGHHSQLPAPCSHPLAGMCAPRPWVARCQQGCCAPGLGP